MSYWEMGFWQQSALRVRSFFIQMLPGLAAGLALFLLFLPLRRRRLAAVRLRSPALREAGLLLFCLFCGGMAALTLTPFWFDFSFVLRPRESLSLLQSGRLPFFSIGTVNLIPFRTIGDPLVFAGNLMMFLPFGFFAALLWRGFTWRRALLLGLAVTAFVECWQLLVGRAFDIDDLLLNTLGVLCGYGLWRLLYHFAPSALKRFHCRRIGE